MTLNYLVNSEQKYPSDNRIINWMTETVNYFEVNTYDGGD